MGQIKTSISIEENVSFAFKSMNTVVNSTLNTFQNFDNVINETPTMNNANESVLNSINNASANATSSVETLGNTINSMPEPQYDYWTNSVGNYSKSALEAVYTTEELVQMGFKTADALKAQESSVEKVNNQVSELKANVSQWNTSQNIELFDSSGIERYKQEINSANNLMSTLQQNQLNIQQQAMSTNILPSNAINDLNNLNNRIITLRNKIQEIEDNKITSIEANQVNNQVEELRERLNNALQAQNELNQAMQNMDAESANKAYIELEDNVRNTEKYIRDNTDEQGKFNQSLKDGNNQANNLGNSIKNIVKAYLGIQGVKKAFSFISDTTDAANVQIQAETKLNTIANKRMHASKEQVQALKNQASQLQQIGVIGDEVTISGQATLGTFLNSTKSVEKLTGAMDNLLAYTNGVDASASDAVSTANQIGKAMANNSLSSLTRSGITVTDAEEETFKKLTSEEEKAALLAEIITNNVGEMNQALANTPAGQQQQIANAWGDMKEEMGYKLYPAVLKFFQTISKNMPIIQNFVSGFSSGLSVIINVLSGVIDGICAVGGFIQDNWSIIEPIVWGIVAALAAYELITKGSAIATGLLTGMKMLAVPVYALLTGATMAETAAQWGLNAAMYACPLVWIIVLIIALIAIIFAVCSAIAKMTGVANSGFGVITGGINVVIQFFKNLGLQVANIALGIWEALCACASNIGTAFHNAICGVQSWFYNLLSTALKVVAKICEALNKLPFVSFDYSGITSKADEYAAKAAEASNNKEEYASVGDAFNKGMSTFDTFQDGWASDAFNAGAAWGDGIADKVGNMFSMDSLNLDSVTGTNALTGYEASNMAGNVADTAKNTGAIADSMDITEEDLKYLRDIAEQEVINRFTTAEINIEMNNNNNINSENDLDGIVSSLEDKIYEMSLSMAEGVHS